MKRLTLIIIGVLLCTPLYSDMNTYIAGVPVSGGGDDCSSSNDTALETPSATSTSATATNSESYRGQSFQHDTDFTFTGVTVYVQRAPSCRDGSLTMILASDNDGEPGSTIASASVSYDQISTSGSDVEILLSTPQTGLSASTTYWVYFTTDTSYAGGMAIHRETAATTGYTNGTSSSYTVSTETWATANYDLRMAIYGCEEE